MSDVSLDIIKNRSGEAPDLPSGANLSGVSTAATLQVTNLNPTHINASGVTTATTFSGSFKSTSTPTLGLGVTINSSGLNISGVATAGIVSATTLFGDGTNLTGVAMSIAPISYTPLVNAGDIEFDVGIGITFTERIIAGSGNVTLRLVGAAGTVVENFGVGSSVTINNNQISITPTANLEGNTVYHLSYPSGAFTNTGGDVSYVGTAYTFDTRNLQPGMFTWGSNTRGELGVPSVGTADRSSPIQIPGTTWSKVAAGSGYPNFMIKTDGTLWAVGENEYGGLGNNSTVLQSSPIQIPGTTWSHVTYGRGNTYALKTNGTLWVWGTNSGGGLGLNQTGPTKISSPTQLPGTTWTNKMSAQNGNFFGIKTDGTLWACGYNNQGQLGLNNQQDLTPSYNGVSSPTQLPGTTWDLINAGANFNIARKTDGTMWTWGHNEYGQLGINNTANRSSPTQIPGTYWSSFSYSYGSSGLAIKTNGTLWAWGYNNLGTLGQNNVVQYSSPTQIPGTTWSKAYTGSKALKTDGTLWTWGGNNSGQLGQNDRTNRSSPVQVPGTWTALGGDSDSHIALKNV